MTSAFWGGFAGGVQKQRDVEYADAQEEKKMRLAEQLKAEYLAKIVDSDQTTYEGDFEVKRNSTGVEISRRQLAPEEIAARKAEQDKTQADTRRTLADASVAEVEAKYAPQRLALDETQALASIESSRASAASSRSAASLSQQRFDHDKAQDEAELTRKEEDAVNGAVEIISFVGASPDVDSSVKSKLAVLDMDLQRARASGDKSAVRRIVSEINGQLGPAYLRAKTKATATGLDGSVTLPPPA